MIKNRYHMLFFPIIQIFRYFRSLTLCFLILNICAFILQYSFEKNIDYENFQNYIEISYYIEIGCNIFFFFELVVKLVEFGFIIDDNSYFRSGWNILDFIIVIFRYFFKICLFKNFNS